MSFLQLQILGLRALSFSFLVLNRDIFIVDLRINWTLQIGEVRKPRLPGREKSAL